MTHRLDELEATCPHCGDRVELFNGGHECPERTFDGFCPICGEAYDSYTTHIQQCDGGL